MMERISKEIEKIESRNRVNLLQKHMKSMEFDGCIILQKIDLFYFSFTIQPLCLDVPVEGKPFLFTRENFSRTVEESCIETIIPIKNLRDFYLIISKNIKKNPQFLGLELDVLPANRYLSFKRIFPKTKIKDISVIIRKIRAIKSEYELENIKKSSEKAAKVLLKTKELLQPEKTEIEISGIIEEYARKLGHQGILRSRSWGEEIFYCSVLAGASGGKGTYLNSPNGGIGPNKSIANGSGFSKIKKNEPIFVDFAFVYNGYIADVSRTFCIGNLPDKLIDAHNITLSVKTLIEEIATCGSNCGDIYNTAIDLINSSKYKNHFMGFWNNSVKFIAHGIGLELDELPIISIKNKQKLKENMVISLEPKMIFPSIGMVGIENVYIVTKSKLKLLSKITDKIIYI